MQDDQLIDHEGAYETTEEKDPSSKREKTNILRQHRLSQEVAALIADTGDEDDSSRADLDRDSDELALLEQQQERNRDNNAQREEQKVP